MLFLLVTNGVLLVKYLLVYFSDSFLTGIPDAESIFGGIEFVLLLLIFRLAFNSYKTRQLIFYLLSIYLSVVITLYFTDQIGRYAALKKNFEAILLLVLSVFCLAKLINEKSIFIFHSPLFWIAGGTLCYYSMLLGIEWLGYSGLIDTEGKDKSLLLLVFNIVRHIFYTIACFQQDKTENELRLFKESSQEYPL
jgi:hypothetical protein